MGKETGEGSWRPAILGEDADGTVLSSEMLTSCMPVCERSMPLADKYRSAHLEPKRKLIKERANYCAGYLHNLDDNLENTVISQRFMTLIRL